jgi:hypothetical protein
MSATRDQLAIVGMAVGAILAVVVRLLILQSHGPTGEDQARAVFGLTVHDYKRWAIFPSLMILAGLVQLGRRSTGSNGGMGRFGIAVLIAGYSLAIVGDVTAYILFDPFDHPLHGIGFFLSLVALLPIALGWLIWGVELARSRSWPTWAAAILLAIGAGTILPLLAADGLVETYEVDPGTVIQLVQSVGILLVAVVWWVFGAPGTPIRRATWR